MDSREGGNDGMERMLAVGAVREPPLHFEIWAGPEWEEAQSRYTEMQDYRAY